MTEKQEENQEGSNCSINAEFCQGVLEYQKPENCSCHISPPCDPCINVKLHCPLCHRDIEND